MTRRAQSTILLVLSECQARADFDRQGQLADVWRRPAQFSRNSSDGMDALVGLARMGKKTWVLSEDVWTQSITIHSDAVRAVTPHELNRALSFEAESLSGIGAHDSWISARPSTVENEHSIFWTAQIPKEHWNRLSKALRRARTSCQGVAHPSGVPLVLAEHPAGPRWQRTEYWPDVTVTVSQANGGTPRIEVLPGNQRPPHPARIAFGSEHVHSESLVCGAQAGAPAPGVFDLSNDDHLRRWFVLWHRCLTAPPSLAPVITPPARSRARLRPLAIAAALVWVAAAACWQYHHAMQLEFTRQTATARQLQARLEELTGIQAQHKALSEQRDGLLDKIQRFKQQAEMKARLDALQRHRVLNIFTALASRIPSGAVIDRIARTPDGLEVTGRSLAPDHPDQLAEALRSQLMNRGWWIQPALKRQEDSPRPDAPWTFAILATVLNPVAPPQVPEAALVSPLAAGSERTPP